MYICIPYSLKCLLGLLLCLLLFFFVKSKKELVAGSIKGSSYETFVQTWIFIIFEK